MPEYKNLPRSGSKIIFDSAPMYCTEGEVYAVRYGKDRHGYVGQVSLSRDEGMTHVNASSFETIGWKWKYADDAVN